MSTDKEFFVPYIEGSLGESTKKILRIFAVIAIIACVVAAILFSSTQKKFVNSTFEVLDDTKIEGTYHKNPYPMLRVQVADNSYKNILLLGFGKFSANPYLEKLEDEVGDLNGRVLRIDGNLIYYNGKTLLQITDEEKVSLVQDKKPTLPLYTMLSEMTFTGEIIDPKCYFGVMKPGKGKIHRSCAVRCISGGIPPVLVTTNANSVSEYFLITTTKGEPINSEILPYIGKPSKLKGKVKKFDDWYVLELDINAIEVISNTSKIY